MKKKLLSIIFFMLGLIITAQELEIIVIGNEKTKSEIIKRFFPKDKLKKDFHKTVKIGKNNLLKTDWFERVDTYVVGKNQKRLIIEVKEGYNKRFGGGPIYFSYGELNYNGKGDSIFFDIGINKQSLGFEKYFLSDKIGYEINLGNEPKRFYENMNLDKEKIYQKLKLQNTFNYRLKSNFILKSDLKYYQIRSDDYNKKEEDFVISSSINYDNKNKGIYGDFEYSNFYNEKLTRLKIDLRKYVGLNKKVELAIRNLYKIQEETNNKYYYLGIEKADEIRHNDIENVIGNAAYLGSLELRLRFAEEKLGGILESSKVVMFLDYGRAYKNLENLSLSDGNMVYGFEYAVSIGSPVYMPIKFRVGFNEEVGNQVGVFLVESF
ncbi:MAG: hypothetical protein ACQERZ_04670 [Fusobacteriota bacterium]